MNCIAAEVHHYKLSNLSIGEVFIGPCDGRKYVKITSIHNVTAPYSEIIAVGLHSFDIQCFAPNTEVVRTGTDAKMVEV